MHLRAMLPAGTDARAQVIAYRPTHRSNRWPNITYTRDTVDAVASHVADDPVDIYVRTTLIAPTAHIGTHQRGGKEHTGAIVAFFADIDVAGPNHKHAASGLPHPSDQQAQALLASLPTPSLTIATGGGYHAWWYLSEPIIVDDIAAAEQLTKQWSTAVIELGRRRGFHIDDVGDLARVGRLCGTTNGKRGRRSPVYLADAAVWPDPDHEPHRYTLEELAKVLAITPGQKPQPKPKARVKPRPAIGGLSPADAAAQVPWADILGPHGWTPVGNVTMYGRSWETWLRPGDPTSNYSLKADPDGPCIVWSSAAGLPAGPGQRLTKFRVLAHLEHQGDENAAARAIYAAAQAKGAR